MRRICENQYDEDKVESLQVQGSFLQFQEMLQNFILEAQVEIEIEDRYWKYVDYQVEKSQEVLSKKEFLEKIRESGKGTFFYRKKELSKSFELNITKILDQILVGVLLLPGSRERKQSGQEYQLLY